MNASPFAEEYEIIRALGKGGTAEVFLARDKTEDSYFALKLPLDRQSRSLSQFHPLIAREYDLLGALKFPGLVRLLGFHDNRSSPALKLEYCPGKTLEKLGIIDDQNLLLNLISSMSISLYYLQTAGLIHGDLKPQNIFVTADSVEGLRGKLIWTKLSDFSLAKRESELSSERLGLGTVGYMAPETVSTGALEYRSDIFALGIIAYILATGRHPFMAEDHDPVKTNSSIRESEPLAPSKINSKIAEALSALIMKMIGKEPEKRPSNGFTVCAELREIGAEYPFEKIIRPKYLLQIPAQSIETTFLEQDYVRFSDEIRDRLLDYGGDDWKALRSLLEMNFNAGICKWIDGYLTIEARPEELIYPRRLKKQTSARLSGLNRGQKKMAVRMALIGGHSKAALAGYNLDEPDRKILDRSLLYFVRQNLSAVTVRKISSALARSADGRYYQTDLAAELYLQAGNFEDGYPVILEAANIRINQNNYAGAVLTLGELEKLVELKGDLTFLPQILMKKADAQKGMGEVVNAEETYQKIIGHYQDRKADVLLAETYKDLGDLYKMKQDFNSGIAALRKAEEIYSALEDRLELSHTINNVGNIYQINNQFGEAFKCYRHALHIQKQLGALKDAASTLNNIAVVYYHRGRLRRMTKIFLVALALSKEIGNMVEIARVHNNLGFAYNEIGETSKAVANLHQSLEINEKIGNKKELLFNYENLIQAMIRGGQLREALKYLSKGTFLSDQLNDRPHIGKFAGLTGLVQKRMGRYGSSIQNLLKATKIDSELDDKQARILWQINTGDVYWRVNDNDRALQIIARAEMLAQEIKDKRAVISILTLRGMLLSDIQIIEAAEKMAGDNNVVRDTNMVRLKKASLLCTLDRPLEANKILSQMDFASDEQHIDIESAGYLSSRGNCLMALGQNDEAMIYLMKGFNIAQASGLLPELTDCAISLAKINVDADAYEKGYDYYRKAIKNLRTMAENIDDEFLRNRFLEKGKIAFLAEEVSHLNRLLGKKVGASR